MSTSGALAKIALTEMLKRAPTPQKALDSLAEQLWDEVLLEAVQAVQRLEQRLGQNFETLRQKLDATDAAVLALRLLDQATGPDPIS